MKHLRQPSLFFQEVDSTNDEAFRQFKKTGTSGLVVIAQQQRKARGRLGRQWHTEPGKSLAISIALTPPIAWKQWSQLTLVAGLALQQCIATYVSQAKIKWPNDILIQGQKVAGILTESKMRAHQAVLVIGIGINLAKPAQGWPSSITQAITDLSQHSDHPIESTAFTHALLCQFDHWYDVYLHHGFSAIQTPWWQAHHASGQRVRAHHQGQYIEGIATAIDTDGCLLLQQEQHIHRIISGEIQLL